MKPTSQSPPANVQSTLVCFALTEEATAFRQLVPSRRNVLSLITGIGRKNAETACRELLSRTSPHRVLTCGFAGGLAPQLKTGDVVFFTEDAGLTQLLAASGGTAAKFVCAERIATTAAEKAELYRSTGADAVEMESAVIQLICRERGIPCATVRVISDTAGEDLPLDFNRLAKPDLNIHYGKLALAIAKSPGKIPALLKLRRQTRFAAEQLARVLARVV